MYPLQSGAVERESATETLESELAQLTGVLNAVHGKIVTVMARALTEDLWPGYGIHSPAHWLAWKTGMSPAHARQVVKVASRSVELPCATAALAAGALSLDQATEIARHVPAEFDVGVTELATLCTVEQLRRVLPRYRFNDQLEDDAKKRRKDQDQPEPAPPAPPPIEERREFAMGTDEHGWWISGHLPIDEGAIVERAIRSATQDLFRQAMADLSSTDPKPQIGLVDGLLAVAEAGLQAGLTAHPGSDRYTIYAHLEVGPNSTHLASLHLGPVLPDHLRRLHTCDANLRPVLERDGVACNVGRDERLVPRRIRRLIEHRDQGCRVPGCHRRIGLDIHHIVHWEDGGPTDSANLVTLCRTHHRQHHLGVLGITGNAAQPTAPDGVTFTDKWGHVMHPTGTTIPADPALPLHQAARGAGATPGPYAHPLGERLDPTAVAFYPSPPRRSVA